MIEFILCRSRQSALASLKSGNKKLALRHAREMKLGTENREKCTSLLNRVEEVLSVIANAESTKKVSNSNLSFPLCYRRNICEPLILLSFQSHANS